MAKNKIPNGKTVVILDAPIDVEITESPFGKRYMGADVQLNAKHLEALKAGKTLAVDVMNEYVVFLKKG
jgi:hypothetical protein